MFAGGNTFGYIGYREGASSSNFYIASDMKSYGGGGNESFLYNVWITVINYAREQNLIGIDARGVISNGHVEDQHTVNDFIYNYKFARFLSGAPAPPFPFSLI